MLEREPRKIKMKNSLLSLVLPRVVRRVDCPASRRIRFACRAVQALFFSRGGTMGKLSVDRARNYIMIIIRQRGLPLFACRCSKLYVSERNNVLPTDTYR